MPLKIAYLLADENLVFSDASREPLGQINATIGAMLRDYHDVTLYCMSQDPRLTRYDRHPVVVAEPAKTTEWFHRNFILPYSRRYRPSLAKRLADYVVTQTAGAVFHAAAFVACIVFGAQLIGWSVFGPAPGGVPSSKALLEGIGLILFAPAAANLVRGVLSSLLVRLYNYLTPMFEGGATSWRAFAACSAAGAVIVFWDFPWSFRGSAAPAHWAPVGIGLMALSYPIGRLLGRLAQARSETPEGASRSRILTASDLVYAFLCRRDFLRTVVRHFRENGLPDILYARNTWIPYPYARIARLARRPLVLEVADIYSLAPLFNGQEMLRRLTRDAEQKTFRAAEALIPRLETFVAPLRKHASRDRHVIFTPLGINDELFEATRSADPSEIVAGRFVVAMACQVIPIESLKFLFETAEILARQIPKVRIVVLGGDKELGACRQLALEYRVSEHIQFPGPLSRARMRELIAHLDVAAIPFKAQPDDPAMRRRILEYMIAGKPVVCAGDFRTRQLYQDRKEILFFQEHDAGDLARKILELHDDPQLARSLAENGAARARPYTCLEITRNMFARLEQADLIPRGAATPDEQDPYIRRQRLNEQRRRLWGEHETRRAESLHMAASALAAAQGAERDFEALPFEDAEAGEGTDRWTYGDDDNEEEPGDTTRAVPGSSDRLPPRPTSAVRYQPPAVRLIRNPLGRKIYYFRVGRAARRARELAPQPAKPETLAGRAVRAVELIHSATDNDAGHFMTQTLLRSRPEELQTTVVVFGPKEHISPRLRLGLPGVSVQRVPMELRFSNRDARIFSNIRKLAKLIRKSKADVVHLHGPQCAPAVRIAAAMAGVPLVVQLHDSYGKRLRKGKQLFRDLERQALCETPLIAASPRIAEDARDSLRLSTGDGNDSVFVVHPAGDSLPLWGQRESDIGLDRWVRQQAAGRKVVLCIGDATKNNRLQDFFLACRIRMDLGDPLFALPVLTGNPEGVAKSIPRSFQETFAPGEAELIRGAENLFPWIAMADLAVCVIDTDRLCLSTLECMEHGVPVVAPDGEANGQWLRHEETGFVYDPGNLASLVAQIRRAAREEELAQRVARNAKKEIAQHTWSAAARELVSIYRRVLSA